MYSERDFRLTYRRQEYLINIDIRESEINFLIKLPVAQTLRTRRGVKRMKNAAPR